MTDETKPSTAADDDDDYEFGRCHFCGGEGWDDCDDPMQCTNQHNRAGQCRCASCGGSGSAKDMTIW